MGGCFHEIEGAVVVLRSKGVYTQAKVYQRNGRIYAAKGSSFIALSRDGTSVPTISVDAIEFENMNPELDRLGRMYVPGAVPTLNAPDKVLLLTDNWTKVD